jgi:hypothetical protein
VATPFPLEWTRSGRATIAVLAINAPAFVGLREALITAHVFPLE